MILTRQFRAETWIRIQYDQSLMSDAAGSGLKMVQKRGNGLNFEV